MPEQRFVNLTRADRTDNILFTLGD